MKPPVPSTGPEAHPPTSGPGRLVAPTARLLLPAGAPEDIWRTVRQTGAGGSDVAAILGLDRYRGPLHVWQDKTGQLRPERDVRLERAARRGHRLESLVAEFFTEDSGLTVLDSPGTLQHIDHPHWIANPDRLTVAPDDTGRDELGVLECKTRTWRSARIEGWRGEEPPDGPSLQAHWYLTVTGYRHAYIAGLLDDDLVWFRLERDDELCQLLADAVDEFWQHHVLTGIPPQPDGSKATADLLARMWEAEQDATADVDPVETTLLLARRRELAARAAELGGDLDTVDNRLRALLGEAEVALVGGRPAYTWRQNGTFAAKRFREAEPELAAAYTRSVPAVDLDRLKAERPETYRQYRARRLVVPTEG
ncbi:YqaJ viral recombinase family protein [Streptomyces sp. NPDC001406]|uniref:YqaJ viral recombinase family nuclease n=1 Tax=Streptomyces sp. NPDC001406 TaxID=3364572 RepID=UPI00368FF463